MTREEAIKILQKRQRFCKVISDHANATIKADELQEVEAIDMAISTLRPVSREMVEKVWRGKWNVSYDELNGFTYVTCSKCGDETVLNGCFVTTEGEPCDLKNFCPVCGAPMTDEAVKMVMERMEALNDGSTTD